MHLSTLLPRASLMSLRSSCSKLHTTIPAPPRKRLADSEECETNVLLVALEEARERPLRMFCALCWTCYPAALFTWGPEKRSVRNAGIGKAAAESLETIGARNTNELHNRVCRWHRARFEREASKDQDHKEIKRGWALEEACMHCGGVLAWGRCDCEVLCQTCWKRKVWCNTRDMEQRLQRLLSSATLVTNEIATSIDILIRIL